MVHDTIHSGKQFDKFRFSRRVPVFQFCCHRKRWLPGGCFFCLGNDWLRFFSLLICHPVRYFTDCNSAGLYGNEKQHDGKKTDMPVFFDDLDSVFLLHQLRLSECPVNVGSIIRVDNRTDCQQSQQ